MGSFGANDDDFIYLGSIEDLPAIENNTLDILAIIKDAGNILEVFGEGITNINALRLIFTRDNRIEFTELVEEEVT